MRNFKIGRTWGVLGKQQTFYGPTHFMGEKKPLNNNPMNAWDYKKSNYRRIDGMANDAQQGGVVPQDTTPSPTPTPTPSPVPFNPSQIANLIGWYDASQNVDVTGSDVNYWDDLTNIMGNLNYAFGTKAVYYTNGFGVNNMPYIQGSNSSQYLSPNSLDSTTEATIYVIFSKPSFTNFARNIESGSGFPSGWIFWDLNDGTNDGVQIGYTSSFTPSVYPTINEPSILRVKWDGITNMVKLNNGTEVDSGSVNSGSQPISPLSLFNAIGFDYGTGFNVAEIVIYNRKLNSSETSQVDSYLSTKYGITI